MSSPIGFYVIFGIVMLPVYVMLIAWFTGGQPATDSESRYGAGIMPLSSRPEKSLLGIGYIVALAVLILFGIWFLGTVLGLFVPG